MISLFMSPVLRKIMRMWFRSGSNSCSFSIAAFIRNARWLLQRDFAHKILAGYFAHFIDLVIRKLIP